MSACSNFSEHLYLKNKCRECFRPKSAHTNGPSSSQPILPVQPPPVNPFQPPPQSIHHQPVLPIQLPPANPFQPPPQLTHRQPVLPVQSPPVNPFQPLPQSIRHQPVLPVQSPPVNPFQPLPQSIRHQPVLPVQPPPVNPFQPPSQPIDPDPIPSSDPTGPQIPQSRRPIRRVLFVGPTGVGKSTLINILFNNDTKRDHLSQPAGTDDSSSGKTAFFTTYYDIPHYAYTDTIGLGDNRFKNADIQHSLKSVITEASVGYNKIYICLKYGRVSQEVRRYLDMITELFGKGALKWTSIIFSDCADENMTRENYITFLIIIIFTELNSQIQSMKISSPTELIFEQLQAQYSSTLPCSCSRIAIQYSKFLSIKPIAYHQIKIFSSREFISLETLTHHSFQTQIDSIINNFISQVPTSFQRIHKYIIEVFHTNQLHNIFYTNWNLAISTLNDNYIMSTCSKFLLTSNNKTEIFSVSSIPVGTLIDELFIETWQNERLYGGLTVGLKFVVWRSLHISSSIQQRLTLRRRCIISIK
ncbi:unnamed protein product [Rotaria sordida]|uniref:AIG1-type G domain-containing protein n=1 Tax=Rotaria sordida TaxID=392033 RepID=A0A815HWM8_9BILA|nr:unnamed protein product [Rotaria sordida]CAF3857094.1 unnamed protein product [Rotaria sordida]